MTIEFYGLNANKMVEGPHGKSFPELIDEPSIGFSNDNGIQVFALLGIDPEGPHGLVGKVTLPEARRAIMKARATFQRKAPGLTRARVHEEALPPGVRRLRGRSGGPGYFDPGLDVSGLQNRLERFAALIEGLSKLGATHVAWS